MAANLRLVVNDHLFPADSETEPAIKDLQPGIYTNNPGYENSHPNYKLLATVLLIHAFAITSLLSSRPDIADLDNDALPMMVNIISAAQSQKEPAPIMQALKVPQKNIEKQVPITSQKPKVTEQPTREMPAPPVATSQENAQSAPVEKAPSPVANHAEPAIRTATAAQEKTETEPVIEPPRFGAAYLNNPAPAYPPLSRRLGEQGRVLLKVLVSENGLAEKVLIDTSSGHEKLDIAAMEAVKKWSFIPAKRSNQPVSAYVLVPVKFSLNS